VETGGCDNQFFSKNHGNVRVRWEDPAEGIKPVGTSLQAYCTAASAGVGFVKIVVFDAVSRAGGGLAQPPYGVSAVSINFECQWCGMAETAVRRRGGEAAAAALCSFPNPAQRAFFSQPGFECFSI
jgi:hypothetical protein